jgi:ABC-type antimicrobial peptide transport system permease subunit
MADRLAGALLPIRIAGVLLSVLGAVGIGLATTGLVAVVSHAASRRRFEVGVRIALGATRAAIVAMFVRDGLYVVAAGCLIGGLLSLGLARVLQALVTQQWLLDPAAFVSVILFLIVVGVGASLRPAVRAGRADPVVALRAE